jgi:hypothetical protein
MDYIYIGAAALGGGWTGYLIGQFSSVKEMNRRLNALVQSKAEVEQEVSRQAGHIEILQDLCADIHAYTTPQKSGTAQKVARMAKAGVAK